MSKARNTVLRRKPPVKPQRDDALGDVANHARAVLSGGLDLRNAVAALGNLPPADDEARAALARVIGAQMRAFADAVTGVSRMLESAALLRD